MSIAERVIRVVIDASAARAGAREVTDSLDSAGAASATFGSKMSAAGVKAAKFGGIMTVGLTAPLLAFGKAAVEEAQETARAMAQIEAALKSTGNQAGRTSAQMQAFADKLELSSLYEGDQILDGVTKNLLRFGNVTGAVFDRATQAAVDYASRTGTSLDGAAALIGKALDNPTKGMGKLQKAVGSIDPAIQEHVKSLQAAGKVQEAQAVLLGILEQKFGGAALAAQNTDPYNKVQDAISGLKETIGTKLLPMLPVLFGGISSIVGAFAQLSPGIQSAVVGGGILLAVLGPILAGIGGLTTLIVPLVSSLVPLAAGLFGTGAAAAAAGTGAAAGATGFGALAIAAAPVALVIAGIAAAVGAAYLVWKNWDTIGPMFTNLGNGIKSAIGPSVTALFTTIKQVASDLFNGPFGTLLTNAGSKLVAFGGFVASVLGPVFIGTIKAALAIITGFVQFVGAGLNTIAALLTGDFTGAWNGIKGMVTAVANTVKGVFGSLATAAVQSIANLVSGVGNYITGKLFAIFDGMKAKIDAAKKWFYGLYDAVVGHSYIPDMVDGIAANIARLDGVMVKPIEAATAKAKDAFKDLRDETNSILDNLYPEQAEIRNILKDQKTVQSAIDKGLIDKDVGYGALGRLDRKKGDILQGMDDKRFAEVPSAIAQMLEDVEKSTENLGVISEKNATIFEETFGGASKRISQEFRDSMIDNVYQIGDALGGAVGDAVNAVAGIVEALQAGSGANANNRTSGVLNGLKGISEKIGGLFSKGSKGANLLGSIGEKLGKASDGAAVGDKIADLAKAVGIKKFSRTGSQIGGAIGSLVPIPGGQIIGSIIGGTIGGLLKKAKTGSATIQVGPDGTYNADKLSGNSGKMKAAAGEAGQAVVAGLYDIASRLGGDLTGNPSVSIGLRDGKYRVDPNGTGKTKTKNGAIDFGKDGAEAAIAFAIRDAIKDGVITGLSSFSERIIRSGSNLDSAISLAEGYEKLLDELAAFDNPLKASVDTVTISLNKMLKMMQAAGATSEELGNVERYKKLKLDALLKDQLSSLSDFKTALSGSGSGVTSFNQLLAQQSKFAAFKGDLAAGKDIDKDAFVELGQSIFSLAGDVYGTSTTAFQSIRADLMGSTDLAIANKTQAFNDATTVAIASQTAQLTTAIETQTSQTVQVLTIANDLSRQMNEKLAEIIANGGLTGYGSALNGKLLPGVSFV